MSESSSRWLREHRNDPYVQAAKIQGYRSRAAFKLKEILKRDPLLKPGMTVLDLGASPGGWTQVVQQEMRQKGRVIAVDRLDFEPLAGVEFLQGDFEDPDFFARIKTLTSGFDVILSDMAPNFSGVKTVDQLKSGVLSELVLSLAVELLKPRGTLLFKAFQSGDFENLLKEMKQVFQKVLIRKPPASRGRSGEVYLLGLAFHERS